MLFNDNNNKTDATPNYLIPHLSLSIADDAFVKTFQVGILLVYHPINDA